MTDKIPVNNQLVMICGYSAAGKTASLRTLTNQEDWIYLACEGNKGLPFKNKFEIQTITDPYQVFDVIEEALEAEKEEGATPYKGLIIDSVDFLMNQFESLYCYKSQDSRQGWQDYGQYYKVLMQDYLVRWNKPTILICHLQTDMHDEQKVMLSHAPVKGALKGSGLEAYMNQVVYARKINVNMLRDYEKDNELLHISDKERRIGVKYVFQTQPTKEDHANTIRGPMDMFADNETYMDNDCELLMNRIISYYGD